MLEVKVASCPNETSTAAMMKTLTSCQTLKIETIKLGEVRDHSRMSKVRGETSANLHSDKVWCRTRPDLQVFLKIMRGFHQWSLGELDLGYSSSSPHIQMTQEDWEDFAGLCSRGKIDKVVVKNKRDIEEGRSQDVEQVKRVAREWNVL